MALPQKSISLVTSFVFNSCDFVDRSFVRKTKDDPRSHTNQHEAKHSCLELVPTFEAKLSTYVRTRSPYRPQNLEPQAPARVKPSKSSGGLDMTRNKLALILAVILGVGAIAGGIVYAQESASTAPMALLEDGQEPANADRLF